MLIALFLIDVEHFKLYNGHYGRQPPDACLEQVARAFCRVAYRAQELVARYSGEEFAILLPETDAAGARRVAKRVLDELVGLAIAHVVSKASIPTASIGIVALVPAPP